MKKQFTLNILFIYSALVSAQSIEKQDSTQVASDSTEQYITTVTNQKREKKMLEYSFVEVKGKDLDPFYGFNYMEYFAGKEAGIVLIAPLSKSSNYAIIRHIQRPSNVVIDGISIPDEYAASWEKVFGMYSWDIKSIGYQNANVTNPTYRTDETYGSIIINSKKPSNGFSVNYQNQYDRRIDFGFNPIPIKISSIGNIAQNLCFNYGAERYGKRLSYINSTFVNSDTITYKNKNNQFTWNSYYNISKRLMLSLSGTLQSSQKSWSLNDEPAKCSSTYQNVLLTYRISDTWKTSLRYGHIKFKDIPNRESGDTVEISSPYTIDFNTYYGKIFLNKFKISSNIQTS